MQAQAHLGFAFHLVPACTNGCTRIPLVVVVDDKLPERVRILGVVAATSMSEAACTPGERTSGKAASGYKSEAGAGALRVRLLPYIRLHQRTYLQTLPQDHKNRPVRRMKMQVRACPS